ncbi:unnamed protein product [Didymodactylos carnosus]|uniref:Mab-21-like HhH/H2TH-like domain-containing protein n=1 Tax=Didymodactylos carnosus TaxID=1234261 RepID=A0A8S2EA30_9BILA|nr:unnamed protein product [Didymodactylos carnosus]CAF3854190.1 unnamed protein product [Didymodactylos carnosus]
MFTTGSCREGQTYSRHFGDRNHQPDLDIVFEEGIIYSEDELIKLDKCPGFVRIKWNNITLSSKPYGQDENGVCCVDGFKIKEVFSSMMKLSMKLNEVDEFCEINHQITTDSAAVQTTLTEKREQITAAVLFKEGLDLITTMRNETQDIAVASKNYQILYELLNGSNIKKLMNKLIESTWKEVKLFPKIFCLQNMLSSYYSLYAPAFSIPLTNEQQLQASVLINFYLKHKHLAVRKHSCTTAYRKQVSCHESSTDVLRAFKLNFWPTDIREIFLNRFKANRPILYEDIKTAYMHLVPKWSGNQSTDSDQRFEFRYSFSAVEIILADKRTKNEKILNGVTRNIYYKYLYKPQDGNNDGRIRSYFVKTTVLWMCEQMDLNAFKHEDDEVIAKHMAEKWIDYVCSLLKQRYCPHYFVDGLNILESCSVEALEKAHQTLKLDVNLDEMIGSSNLGEIIKQYTDNYMDRSGTNAERLPDLIEAIEEYGTIKHYWDTGFDILDEMDAAECCLEILDNLYEFDDGETDNWSRWKQLFVDTEYYQPIPQFSSAERKSQILLFTHSLCISAFTLKSVIKTVFDGEMLEQMLKPFEELSFLLNEYDSSLVNTNKNIYDEMHSVLKLEKPYLPLAFSTPSMISNSLSVMHKQTLLTDHPHGPKFKDLLRSLPYNMMYTQELYLSNKVQLKYPIGDTLMQCNILQLLYENRLFLEATYPHKTQMGIWSETVFQWLFKKCSDADEFLTDWWYLPPLFCLRNCFNIDTPGHLSDEMIINMFDERHYIDDAHINIMKQDDEFGDLLEDELDDIELCKDFSAYLFAAMGVLPMFKHIPEQAEISIAVFLEKNDLILPIESHYEFQFKYCQIGALEKFVQELSEFEDCKVRTYATLFCSIFLAEIDEWIRTLLLEKSTVVGIFFHQLTSKTGIMLSKLINRSCNTEEELLKIQTAVENQPGNLIEYFAKLHKIFNPNTLQSLRQNEQQLLDG